ncbi:MAG: methyltransferase [bacterium]|nr:methyltransferase [bacterium]
MLKRQLAAQLSRLEKPAKAKRELEQYFTPPDIAADIVWRAYMRGEIENRVVADLGAGYGILGLAAALLGAKKVYLIEIDPELAELCKKNAALLGIEDKVIVLTDDVLQADISADTVLQNPPFGIETGKGMDRKFLQKAMQVAPVVYSLHHYHENALRVVVRWAEQQGFLVLLDAIYEFRLKPFLDSHKKKVHMYKVALLYCKRLASRNSL